MFFSSLAFLFTSVKNTVDVFPSPCFSFHRGEKKENHITENIKTQKMKHNTLAKERMAYSQYVSDEPVHWEGAINFSAFADEEELTRRTSTVGSRSANSQILYPVSGNQEENKKIRPGEPVYRMKRRRTNGGRTLVVSTVEGLGVIPKDKYARIGEDGAKAAVTSDLDFMGVAFAGSDSLASEINGLSVQCAGKVRVMAGDDFNPGDQVEIALPNKNQTCMSGTKYTLVFKRRDSRRLASQMETNLHQYVRNGETWESVQGGDDYTRGSLKNFSSTLTSSMVLDGLLMLYVLIKEGYVNPVNAKFG